MTQKAKVKANVYCYISLGSNQGDSQKLLERALEAIALINTVQLLSTSSVYCTEPQGDKEQPWFFNQVAKLACGLEPTELLNELQGIENKLGRVRTSRRFGPRCIDLDILLYGNVVINGPKLTLPHPRLKGRAFVLLPLLELEPDLALPDGSKISDLLKNLNYTLAGDKIYQKL